LPQRLTAFLPVTEILEQLTRQCRVWGTISGFDDLGEDLTRRYAVAVAAASVWSVELAFRSICGDIELLP